MKNIITTIGSITLAALVGCQTFPTPNDLANLAPPGQWPNHKMSRAEREFYQVRNYAASLSPVDRAIFAQVFMGELASRRAAAAQMGAAIAQSSAIIGAGLIQAGAINSASSAIRSSAPTPFMQYMNGYQARQMNSQVHQMNSQIGDISRNVRDIQFRTRGW